MAGETQNYHETRNPIGQTADYAAVTITTGQSILPITTVLVGSSLQFPAGYWDLGKKIHVRIFAKVTTGATPGNFTYTIRYQTGTPTDAGGTSLAASGASAAGASKTNASVFIDFTVEARAPIGTAAALFAKGFVLTDMATALHGNTVNPVFIPPTGAASVNVDTTLASTIHLDLARSGSTTETIAVHDFQVNALT